MFNEIFHNLEFTTENFWVEFVEQYQKASKNNQLQKIASQSQQIEEEPEQQSQDSQSLEHTENTSWWQRTWKLILDQLEIGGEDQDK